MIVAAEVTVAAPAETVFRLAAEVELWPALLPHVRSARVLERRGRRQLFTVRARWRGWPVGWLAVAELDAARGSIRVRHTSPLTRGTTELWSVAPFPDGETCRLAVQIELPSRAPGVVRRLGARIARDLAEMTLARLRAVAEGASLAGQE